MNHRCFCVRVASLSCLLAACHSLPATASDDESRLEALELEADLFVDCDRTSGTGLGTLDDPYASLVAARDGVRQLRADPEVAGQLFENDLIIDVRGTCRLNATFELTAQDSGRSSSQRIIWRGRDNAVGVPVWGSNRLAGFQTAPGAPDPTFVSTDLPSAGPSRFLFIRQSSRPDLLDLGSYFRRATVARSRPLDLDEKSWRDRKDGGPPFRSEAGLATEEKAAVNNSSGVYFVFRQTFTMGRLLVDSVGSDAMFPVVVDVKDSALRNFSRERPLCDPEEESCDRTCGEDQVCQYGIWRRDPHPTRGWFEGLFSPGLVDRSGEFSAQEDGTLLYRRAAGDDMEGAELARLETLVDVDGAQDVVFRGFDFAFTNWRLPQSSAQGISGQQAGAFQRVVRSADRSAIQRKIPAAVEIQNARRVRFLRNVVRHTGGSGIALVENTESCLIEGNLFFDVGGNAVEVDRSAVMFNAIPVSSQSLANSLRDRVEQNRMHGYGQEFLGGVGVVAGYADQLSIRKNLIESAPYTAISVGYGFRNCFPQGESQSTGLSCDPLDPEIVARRDLWCSVLGHASGGPELAFEDCWGMGDMVVERNDIVGVMQTMTDGAGIYFLGQQPDTRLSNNRIRGFRLRQGGGGQGVYAIYFDQGSAGIDFSESTDNRISQCIGDRECREGAIFYNDQECGDHDDAIFTNRTICASLMDRDQLARDIDAKPGEVGPDRGSPSSPDFREFVDGRFDRVSSGALRDPDEGGI